MSRNGGSLMPEFSKTAELWGIIEEGQPMTIILRPEQEQILRQAISSGLARSTDEALDQALNTLRYRLPKSPDEAESTAIIARRLANFGKRHGLSLGGSTIKNLLNESRPWGTVSGA
jgi:hypothetical protein